MTTLIITIWYIIYCYYWTNIFILKFIFQPPHIGSLPSLTELWLDHNQLSHLPPVSNSIIHFLHNIHMSTFLHRWIFFLWVLLWIHFLWACVIAHDWAYLKYAKLDNPENDRFKMYWCTNSCICYICSGKNSIFNILNVFNK